MPDGYVLPSHRSGIKFRRLSQLCTADNGIINEQQALILDQVMYRN